MTDALRVVWYSLKDFWDDFVLLVVLSVLWSLTLALPIVPLFALSSVDFLWALALSLSLCAPLAIVSGALCFLTNQVARGKSVSWGTFGDGLRRYWAKSLVVALINLIVLILFAVNLRFYGIVLEGALTTIALIVTLVIGVYWLLVQVFWFPMILELESERVIEALRNAVMMVLMTPLFSLTLAVVLVLLIAVCVVLWVPAVLIMAALLLSIANHATRSRLAYARREPYEPAMTWD
jgi:hypothetical protein